MKNLPLIVLALGMLGLYSCADLNVLTRTEKDTYTITNQDTTFRNVIRNVPGERDQGIVFPSTRTIEVNRNTIQHDSVVTRDYFDFIRAGVFESAGLIGTTSGKNGLGSGLFGIFSAFDPLFGRDITGTNQSNSVTFTGGLYRALIIEKRLHWFHDAANWTIGTSAVEVLAPESDMKSVLYSSFPLYIRKRYYLREEIPYVAVTPTFGIGWNFSKYVNLGATFDVGSIGGLNMRAYAGYATGITNSQIASSFPYAGLGVSVLDFLNLVPETLVESKNMAHSSWDIGLVQVAALYSGSGKSIWQSKNSTAATLPITGISLKLGNASVALPLFDHKFYLGTSLINILFLGRDGGGVGILPIRLGFWQTVLSDELSTEPFVEYNYYPSSFVHIGNRLNLFLGNRMNISIIVGYASGNTTNNFNQNVIQEVGNPTSFSGGYIGISLNLWDQIFFPQQLRCNK